MSKGMSLIELMICLAVVAILAVVSGSVFSDNILKSRRQSAQNELLQHTLLQGQYRLSHGRYGNAEELGLESSEHYLFTVEVDRGRTFTFSAIARNDQIKDTQCRKFTINQSLQRFPRKCW